MQMGASSIARNLDGSIVSIVFLSNSTGTAYKFQHPVDNWKRRRETRKERRVPRVSHAIPIVGRLWSERAALATIYGCIPSRSLPPSSTDLPMGKRRKKEKEKKKKRLQRSLEDGGNAIMFDQGVSPSPFPRRTRPAALGLIGIMESYGS